MKAVFFGLLFLSSASHAQSVEPGIWEADMSVAVNGIPLPPSHQSECVSAVEARDIKKSILKELEKNGCVSTKWVTKADKVDISLKCTQSGLEATGTMQGAVTAKSYTLNGEAEGTYQNIPSRAKLTLRGKWVKSCSN